MKAQEMALRSEIRQMLNEAGYNKNTLKTLVKQVLQEELKKAINQAIHETNCDINGYINSNINSLINKAVDKSVKEKITDKIIGSYFNKMEVSVKVSPIMDNNPLTGNRNSMSDLIPDGNKG